MKYVILKPRILLKVSFASRTSDVGKPLHSVEQKGDNVSDTLESIWKEVLVA
jgi:hypothetical protein